MIRPIDKADICLSYEDVDVNADQGVLMEVDKNSSLIVGNPQGILGKHIWPRPISLANIILHKLSEQSECSEEKGIKKGIKIFTRSYIDGRACVCLFLSLSVCTDEIVE